MPWNVAVNVPLSYTFNCCFQFVPVSTVIPPPPAFVEVMAPQVNALLPHVMVPDEDMPAHDALPDMAAVPVSVNAPVEVIAPEVIAPHVNAFAPHVIVPEEDKPAQDALPDIAAVPVSVKAPVEDMAPEVIAPQVNALLPHVIVEEDERPAHEILPDAVAATRVKLPHLILPLTSSLDPGTLVPSPMLPLLSLI